MHVQYVSVFSSVTVVAGCQVRSELKIDKFCDCNLRQKFIRSLNKNLVKYQGECAASMFIIFRTKYTLFYPFSLPSSSICSSFLFISFISFYFCLLSLYSFLLTLYLSQIFHGTFCIYILCPKSSETASVK
jgi:hypothetical protein